MKILITGGLGFIGKSLTNKLLQNKKNTIFILDNFQYGKKDIYTKGAIIFKGDVTNKQDWKKIPRADYVYHFAAPSSVVLFNKNPTESIYITIQGFLNCIDWALRNKVKKIIYASSGSVYGNKSAKRTEIVTPTNIYGKTKLVCEHIAKLYEKQIPMLGLRIFAGYGPQEDQKGEFASVITLFYQWLKKKQKPIVYGDGLQKRDFIYINDIVNLLITVAHNETTGLLDVGSGKSVTFNQVVSILNNYLKLNIIPQYVSAPSHYLLNTKADVLLMKKLCPHITPLENGIAQYVQALRSKL